MSARATRLLNTPSIIKTLRAAWPAWLVAGICVAVALAGPGAYHLLEYRRAAILSGQWWRIITGNVVHMGTTHLVMDLAGLALLWILCAPVLAGLRWLAVTLVGMLAVGLGLLAFAPQVAWYVGISGVLHTYWAAGSMLLIAAGYREGWLMIAGLVVKLAWEQSVGPMPFSQSLLTEPVVVAAHLWGSVGGGLSGLVLLFASLFWRGPGVRVRHS
jgi:rhomboid family GlyGly-CTERM serine protease